MAFGVETPEAEMAVSTRGEEEAGGEGEVDEAEEAMGSCKSHHCREVFWHPMYIVWRVGDQARENRSPAPVSR